MKSKQCKFASLAFPFSKMHDLAHEMTWRGFVKMNWRTIPRPREPESSSDKFADI